MFGSVIVYLGFVLATIGLALVVKPIRRFQVTTRRRAFGVAGAQRATSLDGP
jgi:hypothetical protein